MVEKIDSQEYSYGWKGRLLSTIISVILIQIVFVYNANASSLVHRIAGDTRYDTSAAIAKEGWSQSEYVVLAYGGNFPDALAAAPLARKYNAPILLTEAQSLTRITKQTLQDLKVKQVFIVGGNAVVSLTVANQLRDLGITVNRLAGNDRYGTAIEIAKQLGSVQEVVVVSGNDYADALSISSITALGNSPILLVPKDYLTSSIKNYLSSKTITQTYIIGNTEQITESVAIQFPNVERITGIDKYARNIAVLKRFESSIDFSNIFMATGNGFADALAGSAYAARKTAPIVLVDSSYNNATASYLNSKTSVIKRVNILGGEGVMPPTLIQNYTNSLAGTLPGYTYSPSEIAKLVSPSVVYIEASNSYGIPIASGSGFVIDSTGKIATNYQVIKGAHSAKVKTHDGKTYDVSKVYAYDPTQDMALLKIEATGLHPVSLGDSDKLATGDKIYTMGNPLGSNETMSDGLISTKSRVVDGATYIQISAPIPAGSSGGVLLNEQAQVIGITTTGISDGQNLNFATPINLLKMTLTHDSNLRLAELPRGTIPNPQSTKKTDQEFADFLNSHYNSMTIDGKTIRFSWKVNDYKSGLSKISIHGMINSMDFGNWMDLLVRNHRGQIMLYFAKLNNEIALNYPGDSFMGNVLYEDYYTILPSTPFPYDEVSYSGDGRWFVSHPIVTFYDLYSMNKSDPRVTISD